MEEKRCPKCGALIDGKTLHKFCPECGESLSSSIKAKPKSIKIEETKPLRLINLILSSVSAALAILFTVLVFLWAPLDDVLKGTDIKNIYLLMIVLLAILISIVSILILIFRLCKVQKPILFIPFLAVGVISYSYLLQCLFMWYSPYSLILIGISSISTPIFLVEIVLLILAMIKARKKLSKK